MSAENRCPYKQESFRSSMTSFLYSVPPSSIPSVLEEALFSDEDSSSSKLIFDSFCRNVRWDELLAITPDWLNLKSYYDELQKLSSHTFWNNFADKVDTSGCYSTDQVRAIYNRTEVEYEDQVKTNDQMMDLVSIFNRNFYGLAVPLTGMAVVYGPRLSVCYQDASIRGKFAETSFHIFSACEQIGKNYPQYPTNPEDVLERLSTAFDPQKSGNILEALIHTKSFINPENGNTCPAIKFSENIFQSYSNILQNPSYQSSFVRHITR